MNEPDVPAADFDMAAEWDGVAGSPLPWRQWLMPYSLIVAVAVLCHGFLLTNDGTIWDSWFVLSWLKERNWAAMSEFFGSVGVPLYAWLFWPFSAAPDIVAAFMWATFLCLILGSVLTYHLAIALGFLSRGEALAVVLLAEAMPLFLAAQDFIMFFFIFTHVLFLGGALLATLALQAQDWRHWLLRGTGVLALLLSFCNAALLVFYGALYVLLFFCYRRLHGLPFWKGSVRFVCRYPDLLLLPPLAWVARLFLTPQYGWYEHYNAIGDNLAHLGANLWSFIEYVLPYHLRNTAWWFVAHPVIAVLLVILVIAWVRWAPKGWATVRGSTASVHYLWFGILSLFLAIFPFAVAGKHFIALPVSEDSHHLILTSVPMAILLFAVLRPLFLRGAGTVSRALPPVVGGLAIVLGSQVTPAYIAERAEWVFSRSLLHNASSNELLRASSVIALADKFSLMKQEVYAFYGFGRALGSSTRFVTRISPKNGRFYVPPEMVSTLLRTTVLPGEFKRIDPSGLQILLKVGRNRGEASDWNVVHRYLKLRYFGDRGEMEGYLSGLTTLQTIILKPATPLIPAPAPASVEAVAPVDRVPTGNFTNGLGMRLVLLSLGWWAGDCEVTQGQFEKVMGYNPSLFKDAGRPVECVSWNEAKEFCRRLTEQEQEAGRVLSGFGYRLPTVAEFDRMVARDSLGNAIISATEIRWQTAPVGSLPPNALGLHDLAGNVWEWCLDWWDDSHRFKVSMGGAWVNWPSDLAPRPPGWDPRDPYERAATDRLFGSVRRDYPDQGFWDRGFRCILGPGKPASVVQPRKK